MGVLGAVYRARLVPIQIPFPKPVHPPPPCPLATLSLGCRHLTLTLLQRIALGPTGTTSLGWGRQLAFSD